MRNHKKYNLLYAIFAALNSNLGFFFFDYNLSIFNSLLVYLQNYIFPDASSGIITFIASAPIITAAIAALFSGPLAKKIGRRKVMMISDLLAIIGVVLTLFASLPVMIIGRLLIGFNLGTTTVVVPLYFTEIPPPEYIGPFGVTLPLLATLGVLVAFCLGLTVPTYLAPGETSQIWRILLSLSILIALWRTINFLLFFKYDTPQHLLEKEKVEEAKTALGKVYKTGVDERIEDLIKDRDYVYTKGKVGFLELFTKKYRKAVLLGIILMSVQMIGGLNIVMVHAQTIFGAGIDDPDDRLPQYLAIALAAVFHVSSYFLIWFLKKFNRKTLLLAGTIGLGTLEIVFGLVARLTDPANIASKVIMVFWPIPFNLSLGSIPSILLPETLPEIGVSVSFLANWIWGFLTVQFFPDITGAIGVDMTFIIMGGICLIASLYFMIVVVETKGRSKAEILRLYNGIKVQDAKENLPVENDVNEAERQAPENETAKPFESQQTPICPTKSEIEAEN